MERILVIEDDPSIAQGLYRNLKFEGYSVQVANDGEEGLTTAVDNTPDLVLLDVMLPKMNGFEVLREMRRLELEIPVIMLTAKGEEMDKVRGLDLGADDYLTKPFALGELLARIRAVLRRKQRFDEKHELVCFGRAEIDFKARRVMVENQEVTLTAKEIDLLR
ncbi:MAG: response regulator transcription factor, partial [Myxococcota bacterium]